MEAILSSIKKIIADEDRSRTIAPRRASRDSARDDSEEEDILELTQSADDEECESELLDTGKAQSLRQSFSVLQTLSEPGAAPQIVRSGETSLEGLTRDLMRPMLKEWLDTNLPDIVEAMVAREIERITKKG
jgi:cell pole-organizing protein PopZ